MKRCRWRHIWSRWLRHDIEECPGGELITVAVWRRVCRLCSSSQEEEEVLSCV